MKLLALFVAGLAIAVTPALAQSDAQVKQSIVRDSVASYPGPCACPYNTDRAGRSCGRRSAYSRPGGYAPICYPSDISAEQVAAWRRAHR